MGKQREAFGRARFNQLLKKKGIDTNKMHSDNEKDAAAAKKRSSAASKDLASFRKKTGINSESMKKESPDEKYVSAAQRKAVWANKADGGKGHPDNKKENTKADLMKKLAKSAQSSEKGKKAVTLKKAPFDIPAKVNAPKPVRKITRLRDWMEK